jgi:hypothetical protein
MKTFTSPLLLNAAIIITAAVTFSSCKTVYQPNVVNTPLLTNAGEFRAYVDPGNLQLAYAVSDHFGLMANGFYVSEGAEDNSISGHGGLVEAGFGYFTPAGPFVFETYVGGGRGWLGFHEYRNENGNSVRREFSAGGTRFFVQPSIGYSGSLFEIGLTPRIIFGKFDNISTNYSSQDQIDGSFYQIDRPVWTFIEPALTLRGGYKFIKLQAQFGFSAKMNSEPLSYKDSFVNIGISFDLFRNEE